MARNTEAPKIVTNAHGEQRETHPAYGKITVSSPTGGKRRLCGTCIPQTDSITLLIETAEIERKYGTEWVFGKKRIIEVEMSHAQYAHMISSVGNGNGTPCTLRYTSEGNMVVVPEIAHSPSLDNSIKDQFKATVLKTFEDIDKKIAEVASLVEKGRAGKSELLGILDNLKMARQRITDDLPFYVRQFDEHMEAKVHDAGMQIEGIIQNNLKSLGVEGAKNLLISSQEGFKG